ncbi:hypothetical protein QAD02_006402 [Eretmocerus hayati]|uniref:Uncharacterized protein n=1 Tax=Eretmocerus hayati TaxID=131215 RepID=A0ACC2N4Y5_9HYME|nr:hypothetical protein QAD02_006402 [Eretmocerus hayati]
MDEDKVQKVAELREKFISRLENEGPPESKEFHPADINRIKSTDDWLRRFLEHNDYNVQESLKMLWESCEWRRNFGANDITENNVKREYLEDGVCFSYGHDKDGKPLLIIISKLHTRNSKDFGELQRCIVYWFERLEREGNGDQISLFFDMTDTGLSNMDMELVKYLIGLFKNYYPNFLNYILILEMPWVLNAAFNIIKSWLPAKALPKIKFLKKSTLKEFVEPSVALKRWGGMSDYTFEFVSEAQSSTSMNGKLDGKKVHFEGGSPVSEQAGGFGDSIKNGEAMLSIEPAILTFNKPGDEVIGTVTLRNNLRDQNLTYKIKTTSPEKFKVRPSTGILLPLQKVNVNVTLQPGYGTRNLAPNDRFLIMCLPIKNSKLSTQELVDFWKANGSAAEQHKLMCRDGNESLDVLKSSMVQSSAGGGTEFTISSLFAKISRIEEQHMKLQKDFTSLKRLFLLSTVLILTLLIWIIYAKDMNINTDNLDQNCRILEHSTLSENP